MRGHPSVDEIIVFDRRRGLGGLLEVRRAMAAQSLDLLIDLQVYAKASVVTALAPARVKLGFDRARARDLNWLVTTRRIPPHAPQHVHRIADRAHHHDADAAPAHDRRSRTKTTSRIAFGAAQVSNNASIDATGVRSMRSPASTYTCVKRSHTVRRYAVRVMPERRMP